MSNLRRILYLAGGSLAVILGLIGTVVPLLPTTVFLLIAAYLFARSDERALHWLLNNRLLGAYIRNYRDGRGMTLSHKAFTLSLLWLSILASIVFVTDKLWVRLLLLVIASGVTWHLLAIRTYRPERAVEAARAGREDSAP